LPILTTWFDNEPSFPVDVTASVRTAKLPMAENRGMEAGVKKHLTLIA
jgi:hypothetical protein